MSVIGYGPGGGGRGGGLTEDGLTLTDAEGEL